MEANDIIKIIIDASVKIHSSIGPGCFERIYEELLYFELVKRNINIKCQLLMPIEYEELYLKDAYKLDLLVEDKVIVEIKSIESISPVHFKQVMTYLKLMNLRNGILLNFKVN